MSKLADLQLGTGKLKPFTFKRTKTDGTETDVHVLIRSLTKREADLARINAVRSVNDLDKNAREGSTHETLLAEARMVEMLAVALRDPEKPEEPWAPALEIATRLDEPTIALLGQEYQRHQEACGPFIQDMTTEQADALIEAIAKDGTADPFYFCASPMQSALLVILARQHVMSKTTSSSSSSDSTSPSTENASAPNQSSDEAEAIATLTAEVDVQRDEIASLKVRLMHLEAARGG